MRFENSSHYIPIYCREHIEKRIVDFKAKMRKENRKGEDYTMGEHFCKLAKIFESTLGSECRPAELHD